MLHLEYKDFNEAYYKINRLLLQEPDHIQYRNTTMGGLDNLFITCKSTNCDKIDLGALGYKQGKWTHLINTYLGADKVEELKNLKGTGLSMGFHFLRKSTGNGACMLGIVISRQRRKKLWTKATIIWRTTELQRRWAADLILIHRMLELIPNSEFDQIDLYMATAYQSAMYVVPALEPVFDIDAKDLDLDNSYTNMVVNRKERYYDAKDVPHKMLASAQKLVDLYKDYQAGDIPEPIMVKDCKL